jgi:hypothetical protein
MTLTPYFSSTPWPVQFGGKVQAGLAAQVGQQRVRPLLGDDFGQVLSVERLDIGRIGHARIGHDGGRVGIDQHDFVAQGPQGLAGLGSGIVEFAGLADDDGAGTDDQNFVNVVASGHSPSCSIGLEMDQHYYDKL